MAGESVVIIGRAGLTGTRAGRPLLQLSLAGLGVSAISFLIIVTCYLRGDIFPYCRRIRAATVGNCHDWVPGIALEMGRRFCSPAMAWQARGASSQDPRRRIRGCDANCPGSSGAIEGTDVRVVWDRLVGPTQPLVSGQTAGPYSVRPRLARTKANSSAISYQRAVRPERPPCPEPMSVFSSSRLSSVLSARSLATYLAGSQ